MYKVTQVAYGDLNDGTVIVEGDYHFTIDGYFDDGLEFIYQGTGSSPTGVKSDVKIRFYHAKVENQAQFDGKFFVKIYADTTFDDNIGSHTVLDDDEYRVLGEEKLYLLIGRGSQERQDRVWDINGTDVVSHQAFGNPNHWKEIVDDHVAFNGVITPALSNTHINPTHNNNLMPMLGHPTSHVLPRTWNTGVLQSGQHPAWSGGPGCSRRTTGRGGLRCYECESNRSCRYKLFWQYRRK